MLEAILTRLPDWIAKLVSAVRRKEVKNKPKPSVAARVRDSLRRR